MRISIVSELVDAMAMALGTKDWFPSGVTPQRFVFGVAMARDGEEPINRFEIADRMAERASILRAIV